MNRLNNLLMRVVTLIASAVVLVGLYGILQRNAESHAPLPNFVEPHPSDSAPGKPNAPVSLNFVDLPNFVYSDETRTVSVQVINKTSEKQQIALCFAPGLAAPIKRTVALESKQDAIEYFEFCIPDTRKTFVSATAAVGMETVAENSFEIRDGELEELSNLKSNGRSFQSKSGRNVVLSVQYPNQSELREWAPLKKVLGTTASSHVIIFAPTLQNSSSEESLAQLLRDCMPKQSIADINYTGNPIEALLKTDEIGPQSEPTTICLMWGFEEALQHFPVSDFERALDLAVQRIHARSPSTAIALVTPPPIPDTEIIASPYIQAIKKVASNRDVRIVDLNARTLELPEWKRWYSPNDDAVSTLNPNSQGRKQLATWIAEALR